MDKILALACFAIGIVFVIVAFPDGNVALLLTAVLSFVAVFLIRHLAPDDALILTRIFVIGLLARLAFGLLIHWLGLRDFFGGDAATYDFYGKLLMDSWFDASLDSAELEVLNFRTQGVGWGMYYIVAGVYTVTGQNVLAAQSLCGVVGAAIAPLVYLCSIKIFKNRRAAVTSSIFVALLPAFIIWTGQLMKDGLIIFLLVLAMLTVLHLHEKFSLAKLVFLILSLFGIVSLRFYIFYVMAFAVVGSFLVARNSSPRLLVRNLLLLVVIGIAFAYVGGARYAADEFEKYGSLERVQTSRDDLASSAESGFGQDSDVSTIGGAMIILPVGLTYLYLAPFPWDLTNFRQAITLPDMIIWWASIPILISGLIFAVRQRLLESMGILIFTFMLSLAYAVFQGNVGTAYRQRAQIQVFLFIFVGVGYELYKERRENKQMLLDAHKKRVDSMLAGNRERFLDGQ